MLCAYFTCVVCAACYGVSKKPTSSLWRCRRCEKKNFSAVSIFYTFVRSACNIVLFVCWFYLPCVPVHVCLCVLMIACLLQECSLCLLRGGALKPTADPRGCWSHVVCAVTVPEVVFGKPDCREPVMLSTVPRFRQRLVSTVVYLCTKTVVV